MYTGCARKHFGYRCIDNDVTVDGLREFRLGRAVQAKSSDGRTFIDTLEHYLLGDHRQAEAACGW